MKSTVRLFCGMICLLSTFGLADVTLTADGNSGRDACWVKRYSSGVNCWGIEGTGSSLNGNIWWNSFPGESGEYAVKLGAVLEPDGDSPYRFYVASKEVKSGRYPYSTGSRECESSTLKVADIDLGTHSINKGDQIKYWAQSVYPCGSSHGQYSRFYQIKFIGPAGSATSPTEVSFPRDGDSLIEGRTYTLTGNGQSLRWSYDANSDGLAIVDIGTGSAVPFTIPTGVNPPRTIDITVAGDNGTVTRRCYIAATRPKITLIAPVGGETFRVGETIRIRWSADTTAISDVVVSFSKDEGANWQILNTSSISVSDKTLWGNFPWTIPADARSNSCVVSIAKYESIREDERVESGIFVISGSTATRQRSQRGTGTVRFFTERDGIRFQVPFRGPCTVRILDMRGACLLRREASGPAGEVKISGLPGRGAYLLQVMPANGGPGIGRKIAIR